MLATRRKCRLACSSTRFWIRSSARVPVLAALRSGSVIVSTSLISSWYISQTGAASRLMTRTHARLYSPSTASMGRVSGVASTMTCSRTGRGSGISSYRSWPEQEKMAIVPGGQRSLPRASLMRSMSMRTDSRYR